MLGIASKLSIQQASFASSSPCLENDILYEILAKYVDKKDYVFYKNERLVYTEFKKYIQPYFKGVTLHSLRHSYATMLYEIGVDAKTAQNWLGHADIKTTLNIYTHLSKKKSCEDAKLLNDIFGKTTGE